MSSSFTLDTNILINLMRLYPRDIFATLWDSIEAAAGANEICICAAVLLEVKRGGDDLHAWAKAIDGFTCDVTDEELLTVAEIGAIHPDWVRGQVNEADPFVIAHAKAERSVIVTEEVRKGPGTSEHNLKIPNVADEHAVRCIKFFDFVRAHGWSF
ncbi:DUF4411 family protein [Nakamurella endophytica]|uniref:DUF4411 family protein n=1 Tax=Nakamurella endophytica TaxID=1748367 RepID=A0A917T9E1_9ACTN|nr:DUF4411 family protein [Nakamurella endophytica]GGM14312.1 hypothetical protein GCM10011594_37920 [Nakamurella endophytica]